MPSPFVALSQAAKAALLEAPQITGDRVFRGRQRPLKKGHADGLNVRLFKTKSQLVGVGPNAPKDWTTVLAVDIQKRAGVDDVAEDVVDPLLVAVYARLAGRDLSGLGVLEAFGEPDIDWDTDEGEEQICSATLFFQVIHRTQPGALVAWP